MDDIFDILPFERYNDHLKRYNSKRRDLGMESVYVIPSKSEEDEINKLHLVWQYRIGGEKWKEACNSLFSACAGNESNDHT